VVAAWDGNEHFKVVVNLLYPLNLFRELEIVVAWPFVILVHIADRYGHPGFQLSHRDCERPEKGVHLTPQGLTL
jgi:hypothetical protein